MKNTTAFILILVSIGLFYTFIMPEYGKITALRAEASQYKDVLSNVSDLTEKRDELLLKYNAIPQDQLANLSKILPDNVNVVELALNLDAIASKYGISIKNVKLLGTKDDTTATAIVVPTTSNYQPARISFGFVADYASFRKFESDLELNVRILEVKNLNFTTSETGFNQYQMEVETYWLK